MSEKIAKAAAIRKKTDEWVADFRAITRPDEWTPLLTTLVHSLLDEYLELADGRGKTANACLSAAKQVNDKWNAIARKIQRPDGEGLAKDGFLKYVDQNTSGMFQMHLATQRISTQMKRAATRH